MLDLYIAIAFKSSIILKNRLNTSFQLGIEEAFANVGLLIIISWQFAYISFKVKVICT